MSNTDNNKKGGTNNAEVKLAIKRIDMKKAAMLEGKINTSRSSTFNDDTTIEIADCDIAYLKRMLDSLPKQVRTLLWNGVIQTFKGHATARQLQDWWVKSDFYCVNGTNKRYKQDVLNEGNNDSKDFVSTYFTTEGLKISRKGFTPADYNKIIIVR